PAAEEAARLLAAVGESAARIAFCRAASERPRPGEVTGPDLPAEPDPAAPGAWARFTWDNPAFAVRYAHAHAVAARGWAEQAERARSGTRPAPGPDWRAPLTGEAAELVGALFDGPGAVSAAGRRGQPHMLVRYLEGLAASYHGWARSSDAVRGPAADAVALCSAASGVLGAGLALLGASAPTRP
ncbi:DALR anticodon-binding domain-containing protein, partial [Nocardiopsis composta]|uniref:DALR anticodon-binding domain-containing protein n=1 Tax=Nocardiopsis composta TaxID=157465 RepID=UPI0031D8F85B